MKKSILGTIFIALALGVAGCQKQPDVSKLNTQLSQAVADQDYAKAAGINQSIIVLAPTDKAKTQAKQLNAVVKAQTLFNKGKFSAAVTKTSPYINTNSDIGKASKDLNAKAKKFAKQTTSINKKLAGVQELADANNSQDALAQIKTITDDSTIKQPELRQLYIKALTLQLKLTDATNTASASTASKESVSSTSSSAESSSSVPEGQPTTSDSEISADDITQARADIKAAGEDPTYFSNNDIRRAILKAREAGRTHLQASDWQ